MKKVVLITGASSGIGEATAILMKEAGYVVYGAARRIERMQTLYQKGIRVIEMDVTKDTSMVAGVNTIIENEGRIDILVNNAGYGSYGALEDVPMSEAKYQFEVNVFGLARLTQLVLPYMRLSKAGKIINVSSIGGSLGAPHGTWYHATKFAVEGLSDSIRMELKQFGIDVVVIKPGAILTEWSDITQKKMLKVSGETAYGNLVKKHATMLNKYDKQGSDPIVIARVIQKACEAKCPRTRYAAGRGAKFTMFARKVLSDKWLDRMLLGLMK
ncbi:SDR family NAD(P)-dependent oxidoreductase [Prolixibacteraceae bacterium JC049]|nr:SDR family NAD(P)-dependent oxidoreductase [Prolixibacteraceae bacterium JC049]